MSREHLTLKFVHQGEVDIHIDKTNGEVSHNRIGVVPTEVALKHELVVVDHQIRNHEDPDVDFALSGELYLDYLQSRSKICHILGVSPEKGEREKQILELENDLPLDLPYWKLIDARSMQAS